MIQIERYNTENMTTPDESYLTVRGLCERYGLEIIEETIGTPDDPFFQLCIIGRGGLEDVKDVTLEAYTAGVPAVVMVDNLQQKRWMADQLPGINVDYDIDVVY